MYFKFVFLTVLSHLICICTAAENENKTIAAVYYETYCPDSIKFITTQLYPTYEKLNGTYFTPHLQPFGRANITNLPNGTLAFSCQHGEKECYGNKVHACVLYLSAPLSSKLKFVNCSLARTNMKTVDPYAYPIEECATESSLNVQDIKSCLGNTNLTDSLLSAYGAETKKYPIPSFPFIIFNQKFDAALSKESEQDFASVICKNYIPANDTKTANVCKPPNSSATTLAFTAFPVIVVTFLFSKLY
ncbi:GILT-like protein 1 [Planococcus citri]|uniref:GILT-like protein 1 n=1 Tax=Planococcus citri TaxID=170843 RepID=UPI0031F843F8